MVEASHRLQQALARIEAAKQVTYGSNDGHGHGYSYQ